MSTQATNTTPNYRLSQWAEDDRILRQDFNADLAAIDTALAAHDAAFTAVEEKISLVRLYDGTLTANSSALVIDLSSVDMSRFTKLEMHISGLNHAVDSSYLRIRINGQSGEDDYSDNAVSGKHQSYLDIISLSYQREQFAVTELISTGTKLLCCSQLEGGIDLSQGYMPSFSKGLYYGLWLGGTLSDVETLTLFPSSGSLLAGIHVTLYGYRI